MQSWETLNVTKDDVVYTLTLNRPTAMNAFNTIMGEELIDCFKQLKYEKDLRVLIITGAGEKAFCAGADLKERKGMTNEEWHKQHDTFEEAFHLIRSFPFPIIAAVNGYALGGGGELALSCDMRVFAEHAKIGFPEVKIGIIPGVGGTQLLPRSIPVAVAKELLFSGKHLESERAKKLGLANEVVPQYQLMETTFQLAREISVNAPLSLQAIKQSVNHGVEVDLGTGLEIELNHYYKCANSLDRLEGIQAFNEKRKANWQGK